MSRFLKGLIKTVGYYLYTQGNTETVPSDIGCTEVLPQFPDADIFTATRSSDVGLPQMSRREQEVVEALLAGNVSYKDLSDALNISPNTVKTHLRHIYQITGVPNITSLLSYLQRQEIRSA